MEDIQAQFLEGLSRTQRILRVLLQVAQFDLDVVFDLLQVGAASHVAGSVCLGSVDTSITTGRIGNSTGEVGHDGQYCEGKGRRNK